jgi:protein gp37
VAATSIEWTDRSTNPIRFGRGHYCQKISPGCANCYASWFQPRVGNKYFGGTGSPLPIVADLPPGGSVGDGSDADLKSDRLWLYESKFQEVLRRKKPTKYFWCDMTDIFGQWVPDAWIDLCFATMALTPQHTHQVLTKRPERMAEYMASRAKSADHWKLAARALGYSLQFEQFSLVPFPLPNVWLGTSVEDQQRADERIPHLLRTPAAVRFLSCGPLLGPIRLAQSCPEFNREAFPCDALDIDWVIIEGESGPGARPMDIAWAGSLVRQCKAAGVACFVKQMGAFIVDRNDAGFEAENDVFAEGPSAGQPSDPRAWPTPVDVEHNLDGTLDGYQGAPVRVHLKDRKGGDMAEWPMSLRVREFPEVKA